MSGTPAPSPTSLGPDRPRRTGPGDPARPRSWRP
jgi:hypothetical protein